MPRRISLYMLLATIVLIGVLFYQVIEPFVFALLFATVLAVLFRPLYVRLLEWVGRRRRVAAVATTLIVLLLILLPLSGALVVAGVQLLNVSKGVVQMLQDPQESKLATNLEKIERSRIARTVSKFYGGLPQKQQERLEQSAGKVTDGFVKTIYDKTVGFLGDLINFLIGLLITGLTLYYLLLDGESILRQAKDLFPLEEPEEDALIDQFGKVCRGVITGTVVAALAQALLAGVGYLVAGVPNVLLMMAVTMFFAFIPFVGAGSVVTATAVWLAIEQRYWTAGILLVYGLSVVATCDNVIRAYVIGSEAKMNPLIALITVIGAVQLIGLWGIFVGPMIAALFYTLLKLLRDRIQPEDRSLTIDTIQ